MSASLCHTGRASYANKTMNTAIATSGRPVHSVPQPPLRFLPHYSSPIRQGLETSEPRRRDRNSRQFTESMRPLSMTHGGDDFVPRVQLGYGEDVRGCPRSFSAMSSCTPPPQVGSFDPNDLVLPPPKEFRC